jgi:GT2 family glycosyltransferase
VKKFSDTTMSLSKGRNLGYNFSTGEWVVFFDDDIVVSENFFTDIFYDLKKESKTNKIFFGKIFNKENGKNYLRRFIKTKKLHYFNFDSVCSATIIFSRVVLEKIGLFDDRFGVGSEFGACEESDLILKALENHVAIVFEPSFIIFHSKNSFNSSKSYQYGKGLGALYRKHIFKKLFSFPILMIRMVLEWVIRILLVIRFLVKPNKNLRDYHISYLRGFYSGFKNYENT